MSEVVVVAALAPVNVDIEASPPISLTFAGEQGPAGPPGAGGAETYEHIQAAAAADWVVTHNTNRYPSVTVVDSGGTEFEGVTEYISDMQIVIRFSVPISGRAYLN